MNSHNCTGIFSKKKNETLTALIPPAKQLRHDKCIIHGILGIMYLQKFELEISFFVNVEIDRLNTIILL